MAQHLRRPLLGLSSSLSRHHFFHTTVARTARPIASVPQMPRQALPSLKANMKREMENLKHLPNDVGILPLTYIPPTKLPFTKPILLLSRLVTRFRFSGRDYLQLLVMKITSPRETEKKSILRRKVKLRTKEIGPTAVSLHHTMYTLFASGKEGVQELKAICCDGIFQSLAGRIGRRPKNETWQWEVIQYHGSPKLVVHRAARMPIDGMFIRQAVVRITSTQRLTRWNDGVQVDGTGLDKKVMEHVVVQEIYRNWKSEGWRIWGTVEETTDETLQAWKQQDKQELQ